MIVTKAYILLLKKGNMKTMSELKIEPNEVIVRDVQEVKYGKWKFEKDICGCTWFTCTNCHKYIIMTKHRLYPYCPYCGAKMEVNND